MLGADGLSALPPEDPLDGFGEGEDPLVDPPEPPAEPAELAEAEEEFDEDDDPLELDVFALAGSGNGVNGSRVGLLLW